MNIYHYNSETGEFLTKGQATESPLEPGEFLTPAHATTTVPPVIDEGKVAVWQDEKWDVLEDHRGAKYWLATDTWDSEPRTIKDLGPLPDGAQFTAPEKPFALVKQEKQAAIQGEKSRAKNGGFFVDVDGNDVLFDSDNSAQMAYVQAQMKFATDPKYSTAWKASTGTWVNMDKALFEKVMVAGEAHIAACFTWQAQKDAELATAKTIEEVEAIETTYKGGE